MNPALDAIRFEPPEPVPFERCWGWQRTLQERLLRNPAGPDSLLLLEHEPCYTLGRGASEAFLRFDPAAPPAPVSW